MARKQRIGIVVSNKPQKTIIVAIQIRYQHPKYAKTLIKTKRYMAHDELDQSKSGDIVLIEESSPFSKHKKWKLKEVVQKYDKQN